MSSSHAFETKGRDAAVARIDGILAMNDFTAAASAQGAGNDGLFRSPPWMSTPPSPFSMWWATTSQEGSHWTDSVCLIQAQSR